jgi:hypothetical protein
MVGECGRVPDADCRQAVFQLAVPIIFELMCLRGTGAWFGMLGMNKLPQFLSLALSQYPIRAIQR